MSTGIIYDADWSRRVEAIYVTADVVAQRCAALRLLDLRLGERVVDIGAGPGLLARSMAQIVGSDGAIDGIDSSEPMVVMAQRRCRDLPWVTFRTSDATALPYPDQTFDVAVSTQVYEYVSDVDTALHELYRVLRPGGRALIVDTDWDSLVWHSTAPARMQQVLAIFREHCAHPNLPRTLAPRLKRNGFRVQQQAVFALFNPRYDIDTYSHGIIDFIASFVAGRQGTRADETAAWAAELRRLGAEDAYFFSLNRYLFLVTKLASETGAPE